MVTQEDVRRIALDLPGAEEESGRFAFTVPVGDKRQDFVWIWMDPTDPRKPRVANPGVIAIRVASLEQRDALISSNSRMFFTESHYKGIPAVLVRLDVVTKS